ncbi:flagellar biosynthesis protein FlhF [Caldalkalibacillus salinus]|uniref:flagellar biosynthesis protein FlhF n=1 Tax=Caldalkalibacillus salinus TaxID=2803787 RepID=UPI0019215B13|nr:flagellar biosynthesis protein FlhF [Caldalkalibacillus salinus]
MKIKKYVVDSLPDAMQQIRHELGNQAVILNTKKVRRGGVFGLFSREQIEVIAAIDQDSMHTDNTNTKGDSLSLSFEGRWPHKGQYDTHQGLQNTNAGVNSIDTTLKSKERQAEQTHSSESQNQVLQELKEMKEAINTLAVRHNQASVPYNIMYDILTEQGVDEKVKSILISRVFEKHEALERMEHTHIYRLLRKELLHYLDELLPKDQGISNKCPKIMAFIGPTGVGKTTTIAKLAAEHMLKQHKKVGLITTDTYRIAAVDQLKTYANILNVPVEVIFSPDELEKAIQTLADVDIILMDTAGRNYLQQEYIDELQHILPDHLQIQVNMVLSLTTKYDDLKRMAYNFKQISIDQFILTKVDETHTYGTIINLLHECAYPLTYLTNGQDVPDDILKASPEIITDLIMGDDVRERSS